MQIMLGPVAEWIVRTIAKRDGGLEAIKEGVKEDVWVYHLGGRVMSRLEWRDRSKRTDAYIFTQQGVMITEDDVVITEPQATFVSHQTLVEQGKTLGDMIDLPDFPPVLLENGIYTDGESRFDIVETKHVILQDVIDEMEAS